MIRNMIDTTANVTPFIPHLIQMFPARDLTISRYMAWASGTENNYKVIHKPEAYAILDAGFGLILNSEGKGNNINYFSRDYGERDATAAMNYAKNVLGAPPEVALAFSCEPETLPSGRAISITNDYPAHVRPYWARAKEVLGSTYRIGAYSFGTWLDRLLADSINEINWLPGASGWPGYQPFLNSGRWHYRQDPTGMEKNVFPGALNSDWGFVNPAMADIGAWRKDIGSLPPVPVVPPTIWRGSIGDTVKLAQSKLGVTVDGIFGPNTEKAVKAFQTTNGLFADGIVGPLTWAKLAPT